MPPKISKNPHSDIIHLILSFKKLKLSKKEKEFIDKCFDNLLKLEPEQLQLIKEKFKATLHDINEFTKEACIHSHSESLQRLMYFMGAFTTLTTIATILAILIFLPVIETVAVLLCAVLASLFILLVINIMLLNDNSPALSNLKEKITCSFYRLEDLSKGIVKDDEEDEEDENLDETAEDESTLTEHANDTSSGSFGRNGLFSAFHTEAANNNNATDHDHVPLATSTP